MLFSCNNKIVKSDKSYLVKEIKSINNWNIIYAVKKDSIYKIVTQKVKNNKNDDCDKVVVGNYYNLVLHSRKNNVPEINGIKINPTNNLDVNCYSYDENTSICIETKKKIFDLHHTSNIKGLCYVK